MLPPLLPMKCQRCCRLYVIIANWNAFPPSIPPMFKVRGMEITRGWKKASIFCLACMLIVVCCHCPTISASACYLSAIVTSACRLSTVVSSTLLCCTSSCCCCCSEVSLIVVCQPLFPCFLCTLLAYCRAHHRCHPHHPLIAVAAVLKEQYVLVSLSLLLLESDKLDALTSLPAPLSGWCFVSSLAHLQALHSCAYSVLMWSGGALPLLWSSFSLLTTGLRSQSSLSLLLLLAAAALAIQGG